jgi:hypothetical protein
MGNKLMVEYFVKLSVGEDYGEFAMYGNINMDFEARDEMDAINKAISNAFDEARENGAIRLSSIFVSKPRLVSARTVTEEGR